jgi:S-adenosylmethionine:tRNA ribosyltransferase-isomerase
MKLSSFDFHLPEERIALRPVSPRHSARLLRVAPGGDLSDLSVSDLPGLLAPGDALVFNDTRVIAARLNGHRSRGEHVTAVEATLLKRLDGHRWTALMKPGRRLAPGDRVRFGAGNANVCELEHLDATVEAKSAEGPVTLAFDLTGVDLDLAIAGIGHMPLPPYIAAKRTEDAQDQVDYQTVYARVQGSVAAPTAGLHFTPELLDAIAARGVSAHFVTLHVGAGTFLPVKTDDVSQHRMHPEWGEVDAATAAALNAVRAAGGRIICVGTTALRLIESATGEDGVVRPFADETAIFITPGYRFRAADGLMTNFHLPKSTLFMLVSAFAGPEVMKRAYAHAIESSYRFYSYGDASLLWRAHP